ncbi:MAG: hypothetical protein DBX59_02660 [Bacillota bacterium]|nr:MAG: hypothetical protein DBX59_02660 [Bacillota bacterium]
MSISKQKRLIFLCWLIYTAAYFGRYGYNANITLIESAFGVTHAESGLVTTCFFFAYGAGQIVNGLFCKYYPKRVVLAAALFGSAIINAAVYFGAPFAALKYMWLLNGILQSVLWSSLICVLSENLDGALMNKAIIVMSTTVSVGTLITYSLSALLAHLGVFELIFIIAAAVLVAVGAVWLIFYCAPKKSSPRQGAEGALPTAEEAVPVSEKKGRLPAVLAVSVVIMALFAAITNLAKDGLQTWVPAILKESYSLPDSLSIVLTLVLPVLGIFGAVFSAQMHKVIGDFVSLAGVLLFAAGVCIVGVLLLLNTSVWIAVLLLFGVVELLMHASNNVITSMMPLYLRGKFNSGRLAGILNGCCYVGSTLSSYGLGALADSAGWSGVFCLLCGVCFVSAAVALCFFLYLKKTKKSLY